MNTRKNPTQKKRGGLIPGFILGLIVGLVIAIVIAMMITRTPIPFNKSSRSDKTAQTPEAPATDPNQSLYGNRDVIKDLIQKKEAEAAEAANKPDTDKSAEKILAEKMSTEQPKKEQAKEPEKSEKPVNFYLQAGAFKSRDDANDLSARLALLGYEAHITETSLSSGKMYRVRLGPFKQNELGRVQGKLKENGIAASSHRG